MTGCHGLIANAEALAPAADTSWHNLRAKSCALQFFEVGLFPSCRQPLKLWKAPLKPFPNLHPSRLREAEPRLASGGV